MANGGRFSIAVKDFGREVVIKVNRGHAGCTQNGKLVAINLQGTARYSDRERIQNSPLRPPLPPRSFRQRPDHRTLASCLSFVDFECRLHPQSLLLNPNRPGARMSVYPLRLYRSKAVEDSHPPISES